MPTSLLTFGYSRSTKFQNSVCCGDGGGGGRDILCTLVGEGKRGKGVEMGDETWRTP